MQSAGGDDVVDHYFVELGTNKFFEEIRGLWNQVEDD